MIESGFQLYLLSSSNLNNEWDAILRTNSIRHHFLKKNKLFVGYAFDYVVHNVNAKAPISHELVVRYDLPTPQMKKPIRTPRFFY